MRHPVPADPCESPLAESANRLSALVEKLERDGYPCEVRAARRALNSLNRSRAARARPMAGQDGAAAEA